MPRRYLTIKEAEAAIQRGKTVECFLGTFIVENEKFICWATFDKAGSEITASIWEAYDQGSPDYLDIYSFDSPTGECNEPVKEVKSKDITSILTKLNIPESKLVNKGVVQDEYADYIATIT